MDQKRDLLISEATYAKLVERGWKHSEICDLVEGLIVDELDRLQKQDRKFLTDNLERYKVPK